MTTHVLGAVAKKTGKFKRPYPIALTNAFKRIKIPSCANAYTTSNVSLASIATFPTMASVAIAASLRNAKIISSLSAWLVAWKIRWM